MKLKIIILVIAAMLILQGCGSVQPDTQPDSAEIQPSVTETAENNTADAAESASAQTSTANQDDGLILPITENKTGKTLIQTVSGNKSYPYTSYIISSANGENVVLDPTAMPSISVVDIHPAAIVSTHSHPDHVDPMFTDKYDCLKLINEEGQIKTDDFTITSILSSHDGDTLKVYSGNKIVLVEVDGLRIAHMGDIGQTFLTDEQLQILGHIDIAFMQFENSYSNMWLENEKGFKLIEQLNPVIIIPTHYTDNALPVLEEKYGPITEIDNCLEISKEDLPEGTLNVYRILNNHIYK